jgi:guanine deaminase
MQAFIGDILQTRTPSQVEFLAGQVILVAEDGEIAGIASEQSAQGQRLMEAADTLARFEPGQILLPGLIDLHIHAPQFPQIGQCLDLPLDQWLATYTFPLEARYADLDFARTTYRSLVSTLLANGTTTAAYFATIHGPASLALAEICIDLGQRALVGRVAMDHPDQCPSFYRDPSPKAGIEETRRFIDEVRALPGNESGRVEPIVTPRFIPACSDALLHGLGALAAETGCAIQTHCSESAWEHQFVLKRCGMSDTAALQQFGLLTRRTILAHSVLIGEDDQTLIHEAGAGIAHCPISNAYFANAIFPLRRVLERGIHVGLGTDIAGGHSPSILENARQAVIASRLLEDGITPIGASEAFYCATTGGGIALDLPIGRLSETYRFDALLIDGASASNLTLTEGDTPDAMLAKILYLSSRSDIKSVWVDGRRV